MKFSINTKQFTKEVSKILSIKEDIKDGVSFMIRGTTMYIIPNGVDIEIKLELQFDPIDGVVSAGYPCTIHGEINKIIHLDQVLSMDDVELIKGAIDPFVNNDLHISIIRDDRELGDGAKKVTIIPMSVANVTRYSDDATDPDRLRVGRFIEATLAVAPAREDYYMHEYTCLDNVLTKEVVKAYNKFIKYNIYNNDYEVKNKDNCSQDMTINEAVKKILKNMSPSIKKGLTIKGVMSAL